MPNQMKVIAKKVSRYQMKVIAKKVSRYLASKLQCEQGKNVKNFKSQYFRQNFMKFVQTLIR